MSPTAIQQHPRAGRTIFILSDTRSGSTLLDQLLGGHPKITSLGEVHWLLAYATQDRSLYDPVHPLVCSCGEVLRKCPFWLGVEEELGRPLESMRIRLNGFNSRGNQGWWSVPDALQGRARRLLERWPQLFLLKPVQWIYGGRRTGLHSNDLYDAALRFTQNDYLVDSSKNIFRFRATYDCRPGSARAILFARDYRAVAYSKIKRGRSLEYAAHRWKSYAERMQRMTADIPATEKYRLRYEDLCSDPRGQMSKLCDFLGLEFSEAMLQRPTSDVHHIGGSPSKFDPSKVHIAADTDYKNHLSEAESLRLKRIVGSAADPWGY
jgi:hypothetical protein